jgi:para-nitrobenzyl esterase
MDRPIIDTPYGRIKGTTDDGVTQFLGIPYAAPPTGDRRLRSPLPATPWPGVRDAAEPGNASLQQLGGNQTWLYEPLPPTSEDCLYLNVWTPDVDGRSPIFVWFHGGATRNGHGAAGAFRGANLARRGQVIVVTVNYRLGALGGLAHPDLADPVTGRCANWGLQDKIATLRWIQECAHVFGGDADNVTIAGQSSGAMNVALMAQNTDLDGLFHRTIMQSPPLFQPPMFAELAEAAEYTEALAASFGVPVAGLAALEGLALFEAENAFSTSKNVLARMRRPRTSPVRDGMLVREWPYRGTATPQPMLIGWNRDEARFWYDLSDAHGKVLSPMRAPENEQALVEQVGKLIRLYYPFAALPQAGDVIGACADPSGPLDVDSVWNDIYTDLVFRAPIVHYATKHAGTGVPTFAYEFGYPLPHPGKGTPHAADVPFVFGTTAHPHLAGKVGHGDEVAALSGCMMDMWTAFMRSGDPSTPAAGLWSHLRPSAPAVMRLDSSRDIGTVPLPRADRLRCWPAFEGGAQAE